MVKQLFRKMLPATVLSGLAATLCMQVDIVLIGQFLGVDGIASYGLANPVLLFFTAVTGLIAMGVGTVCSRLVGKGDACGINGNFSSAVAVTLAGGTLTTLVLALGLTPLITFLGAEEGTSLFETTADYLKGYLIGIPAYFLMTALAPYLHIAGKRRTVIASIAVMTALDVVLDIVFGSMLEWGMFGMGLATSVSEIGGCLVILVYFLQKNSMFRFRIKSVSAKHIGMVLVEGLPIAVNQICFTVSVLVVNRLLLAYGGSDGVAVYSVLSSVASLCFSASQGVGNTVQVLTGIYYGEEDRGNVYETLKQGFLWAVGLNAVIAALFIALAPLAARVFVGENVAVSDLTAHAIRIFIFNIVPMSLCVVFKNYYPCIKKLSLSLAVGVLENLVIIIPVNYLMAYFFESDGLWAAKSVAECLTLGAIGIYTAVKNRKVGWGIQKISLLSKDFPIADSCIACFDIKGAEDISAVSEAAGKFCLGLGCKPNPANYISLCIEEMAAEIIARSFEEGKHNLIEVRIVKHPEGWTVRMRDNCKNFDIVGYMNLHKEDDSISHLGVRMVSKFITEANYINSLGFNCLTMKLSD